MSTHHFDVTKLLKAEAHHGIHHSWVTIDTAGARESDIHYWNCGNNASLAERLADAINAALAEPKTDIYAPARHIAFTLTKPPAEERLTETAENMVAQFRPGRPPSLTGRDTGDECDGPEAA